MLIGYFAALMMGLTLGMIGAGGSILTVPILGYVFGVEPILATAYSLFVVGATALVGAVGIGVGVALAGKVPAARLRAGFGWFVLLAGFAIIAAELG